MKNGDYQFYKSLGICPVCCKNKHAPGKVLCWDCEQRSKKNALRYYHTHKYEKSQTSEEKRKKAESCKKYREDHRKRRLCCQCSRPATHGCRCDIHYKQYLERNPHKRPQRNNLRIPEAGYGGDPRKDRDARRRAGDIITLRNAGWTYRKICDELGVTYGTVSYYIKKAKRSSNGNLVRKGKMKKQYVLWDNGKLVGEYTSRDLAKKLYTKQGYINQAMHGGHVISGRYQITEDRTPPPPISRAAIYTVATMEKNVVFRGTALEIAKEYGVAVNTVYSCAARNNHLRLRGKYTITKDQIARARC